MPDSDPTLIIAAHIEEFRANDGRVGGPFNGAPLLLLITKGRRTGQLRTNLLTYRREGDRLFVFATNNAADAEPAWLHNLRSDPRVDVELGPGSSHGGIRRFTARALSLTEPERDAVWYRQTADIPRFAEYQQQTERKIAVIELIESPSDRPLALGDQLRLVHADLRADLAELRRQVRDLAADRTTAPSSADPTARLRRQCLAFCDAIHAHHTGEDTLGFPRVEQEVPALAPAIARMRAEHVRVADLQQRLREAMQDPDPVRTKDLVDQLTAELEHHFDYEEDQLVDALNALDTSDWGIPAHD